MRSDRKQTLTAVERTLAILEAVVERGGMTNAEVARRLEIPKSSAWYILRTLEAEGYLFQNEENGTYRCSSKLFSLTLHALTAGRMRQLTSSVVARLAQQTGQSAGLTYFDKLVQSVNGPTVKLNEWASPTISLHSWAAGKLLLAYLPETERLSLLQQHGMPRYTSHTITQQSRMAAELDLIRGRGFAIDNEECVSGLRSVAAPIFGPLGIFVGAIGVVGVAKDLHEGRLPQFITAVKQAARVIAEQLELQSSVPVHGRVSEARVV